MIIYLNLNSTIFEIEYVHHHFSVLRHVVKILPVRFVAVRTYFFGFLFLFGFNKNLFVY